MATGNVIGLTVQQALNYYAGLLILQYNGLPNASQTIQCLTNCSVADGLPFTLANSFNLQTAVGNQLTILGKIVGVPRQIYGLDLVDTFFTFSDWHGQPASVGFNTWATPVDPDKIASWYSTSVYTPTDFEMLALIQLKIMRNNFYPSLGVIAPAVYNIFGTSITVTDTFNTSLTWSFKNPFHNVGSIASFLNTIVPKPAGVAAVYQNI